MALYLIHFLSPISPDHTTQHYLGFADGELDEVLRRVEAHALGRGARLTEVALERKIPFTLARVWLGEGATRAAERRLKNGKQGPRLCPHCHPGTTRGQLEGASVLEGAELEAALVELDGLGLAEALFRHVSILEESNR